MQYIHKYNDLLFNSDVSEAADVSCVQSRAVSPPARSLLQGSGLGAGTSTHPAAQTQKSGENSWFYLLSHSMLFPIEYIHTLVMSVSQVNLKSFSSSLLP